MTILDRQELIEHYAEVSRRARERHDELFAAKRTLAEAQDRFNNATMNYHRVMGEKDFIWFQLMAGQSAKETNQEVGPAVARAMAKAS